MAQIQKSGTPVLRTTTGNISLVPGNLLGFYVNSTTAGTVVFADGAGGTVFNAAITPAIGFHKFPAACSLGCHVTIANTLNATFFFAAG